MSIVPFSLRSIDLRASISLVLSNRYFIIVIAQ